MCQKPTTATSDSNDGLGPLLPCPFCGEDARHSTYQDESIWNHNIVPWHVIGCPICEIEMRQCDGFDDILACWNSRPRVEELEAEHRVYSLVREIQVKERERIIEALLTTGDRRERRLNDWLGEPRGMKGD